MNAVVLTDLPGAPKAKVTLVAQEISQVPAQLSSTYGSAAQELSITECQIKSVSNLAGFTQLKNLVLDNNEIGDENTFPAISTLETLWINHNNISRLDRFLDAIEGKFPRLTYLSMLKNPCCPNYLVGKGSADYKKYRITVVARVPSLKFLDASPVTSQERAEAETLQKRIARADPSEYQKAAPETAVEPEKGLDKVTTAGEEGAKEDTVAFGQTRYVYYGRHSEGNRFIVDKHL